MEWKLTKYKWSGCTNIELRDSIMSHATELIRQIIRKQGLHQIYPGHEESAFSDLIQTAWVQIERTLYKYRGRPHCRTCFNPDRPSESAIYDPHHLDYHIITYDELLHGGYKCFAPDGETTVVIKLKKCDRCNTKLCDGPEIMPLQGTFGGSDTVIYRGLSKVFNMWSQVARTVILAYIKKEGRDRKNSGSYRDHLTNKGPINSDIMDRFFVEAAGVFKYNESHLKILEALNWLFHNDDKPYDGIIGKLVERSGMSRAQVSSFIRVLRLRSYEFSDSPINRMQAIQKPERRRSCNNDFDDD